ncbi:MAG: branched-chain amino acid ABC transporter permease [Clostridia bacterium]|nr:branched-chain amino acid ABC transporter permease [Clostridia bacterium]
MSKLKSFKWKYYINYAVVFVVGLILTLMSFTVGLEQSTIYLLEKMLIAIILAVSLNLVVGFLGELSLGHAGFMCVGAYLGGKISLILADKLGTGPLSLIISLTVGGLCAALCGVIIGLPALRLKGDYLAIVTLGFGEIVKSIFQNTSKESFGGALGLDTPRYDKYTLYIFGFALVLLTLAVVQNLMRSKHGRAITSIRDNEIAARATGINVTKYKLMAFTVSAFFAGIAGVLYSFSNFKVNSYTFGYNYSIEILVMVVLGGIGSINGSIISAALITFLNTKLATILTGDKAVLQNLFYAVILIIIVIYNNSPALKGFREKYDLKKMFSRVVKHNDPSVIRDDQGKWARIPTKIPMDEVLSTDVQPNQSTLKPDKSKEDK